MTSANNSLGSRVSELRDRLKLSQQAVADRGGIDRLEVLAVEKSRNKATSYRIREGLARGFGLSAEQLAAFIVGALSVDEAAQIARAASPDDSQGTGTDG